MSEDMLILVARHDEQLKAVQERLDKLDTCLEKLDSDLNRLDELLNQGKGAYWALAKVGAGAILLIGALGAAINWVANHVVLR